MISTIKRIPYNKKKINPELRYFLGQLKSPIIK